MENSQSKYYWSREIKYIFYALICIRERILIVKTFNLIHMITGIHFQHVISLRFEIFKKLQFRIVLAQKMQFWGLWIKIFTDYKLKKDMTMHSVETPFFWNLPSNILRQLKFANTQNTLNTNHTIVMCADQYFELSLGWKYPSKHILEKETIHL